MAAPSVVRLRVLCVTSPKLRNLSIKYSKYGITHRSFRGDKKQKWRTTNDRNIGKSYVFVTILKRHGAVAGLFGK